MRCLDESRVNAASVHGYVAESRMIGAGKKVFRQPILQIELFLNRQPSFSIRTGQEQQGLNNSMQMFSLGLHRGQDSLIFLDGPLSAQGNFDLTEDGCKRRAKLVRRIAGELSLALEGFLQPIQKVVKGFAQVFEFISRSTFRQALAQVGSIHLTSRSGHLGYGEQCSATNDPTHEHRR